MIIPSCTQAVDVLLVQAADALIREVATWIGRGFYYTVGRIISARPLLTHLLPKAGGSSVVQINEGTQAHNVRQTLTAKIDLLLYFYLPSERWSLRLRISES